jgi:hypothetical protein
VYLDSVRPHIVENTKHVTAKPKHQPGLYSGGVILVCFDSDDETLVCFDCDDKETQTCDDTGRNV